MTIKKLRQLTRLSQAEFGERFGIPCRTIENWESEKRHPPKYVIDLLEASIMRYSPDQEIYKEAEAHASAIAKILNVPTPDIYFTDCGVLPTPTTASLLDVDQHVETGENLYTLVLNKSMIGIVPMEFSLAHEIRHVWQIEKTDRKPNPTWQREFSLGASNDANEYNSRSIEKDANAFAISLFSRLTGKPIRVIVDYLMWNIDKQIRDDIARQAETFF